MKEPLVTVYITNYNYSIYIEQSINSLLSQTFSDYELIIIDDGSTDNSRSIIERYKDIARIVFQKNQGLNISNNIALKMANGKYIIRLDADDFLEPEALSCMVDMLESDSDLGLVFPDYFYVDKNGFRIGEEKRHNFSSEVAIFDQPAHGACTMIRKKFLHQLGGYDERYKCQDGYDLWLKIATKYKVANISRPLFSYRQHGDSLSSNEDKILSTRRRIKDDYIQSNSYNKYRTLAVVPIRGTNQKSLSISSIMICGKSLLQLKVDTLLQSKRVNKIIITSSNQHIRNLISSHYSSNGSVEFVERAESLERMNISLYDTARLILDREMSNGLFYDSIIFSAVEYPLITSSILDDAINTLYIFKADSLISVRPIDNSIYQHKGFGMVPIVDPFQYSRIERDVMYRYEGGIIVTNTHSLNKYHSIICGKVSHIVIDQKSAFGVSSKLDIQIVDFLYKTDESS